MHLNTHVHLAICQTCRKDNHPFGRQEETLLKEKKKKTSNVKKGYINSYGKFM